MRGIEVRDGLVRIGAGARLADVYAGSRRAASPCRWAAGRRSESSG
jgi:hypothetical protein